ncbi:MAG TPA: L-threonylcarbamoyladenylate synthase [Gemmatimonadales bacterium]|jgi:L-threonylcarbamoyladenylate synthase|nr:L-threonylcarbamoyladenylate synthase [Gemmatimonadales bacterium]
MILAFRTEAEVREAAEPVRTHLDGGGLLAYPTETVYGLGSAPRGEPLIALAALKKRPPRKPFLLLVSGRLMAEAWGLVFPPAARAMADAFWPGPLTLVLRGGEGRLPDMLRGPEGGIAVRFTSHAGMALLVKLLGFPVTSTSANRPGGPPAPGVARLEELFRDAIGDGTLLVLDGGVLGNVPPSTIVDCTTPVPVLIREGALPRGELRRAVGRYAP